MQNIIPITVDIKILNYILEKKVTANDDVVFIIDVTDNGTPIDLTNVTTTTLANKRLDGRTVITPGVKGVANRVTFNLGRSETAVKGRVDATVQLYDVDGRVSTLTFRYTVVNDPTGSSYLGSEGEQTLIEVVLGEGPLRIQEAIDATKATIAVIEAGTEKIAETEAVRLATETVKEETVQVKDATILAKTETEQATSDTLAMKNATELVKNETVEVKDATLAVKDSTVLVKDATLLAKTSTEEATVEANKQGLYAKTQGDVTKQVGLDNKLIPLPTVATIALRNSTYPNPQHGSVVIVSQGVNPLDAETYRFVTGTGWVLIERTNATTTGNITAQLAEKAKQTDVRLKAIPITELDIADTLKQQINGNAPILQTIGNGVVSPLKTSFIKRGNQLFNKSTVVANKYVSSTTGALVDSTTYYASDYIPVTAGLIYYKDDDLSYYAWFDSQFVFISGGTGGLTPQKIIIAPANASFLRRSIWKSDFELNRAMVNEGSVALPYESYTEYLQDKFIKDINASKITGLIIPTFDKTKNLYNEATINRDFIVNQLNGLLSASVNSNASDYVPVLPSTVYSGSFTGASFRIAYYNSSKVFISGAINPTMPITTPANCYYVRFSEWKLQTYQFELGSVATEYIPHGYKSDNLVVGKQAGVSINLPSKIYGLIGHELNVYFYNIVNVPLNDLMFDVTCTIGKQLTDKWTVTPTAAGTYSFTVDIYKDYTLVTSKTITVIIKASTVGSTSNKTALIIGDSTVNQLYMLNRLIALTDADPYNLTLLGSLGTAPVKHEGRGGWSGAMYRTNATYLNVVNPFYDSNVSDFNFSTYMTSKSYAGVDYVGICLGINDVFSYTSDNALNTAIATALSDLDFLIANIHTYNNAVKVGVFVTIPPTFDGDLFGEAYGSGQTLWRYKRNNAIWLKNVIAHYDNRTAENIYLIPDNNNINAKTGFKDGVHPNETIGDVQRGNTLYYWLKSFEV